MSCDNSIITIICFDNFMNCCRYFSFTLSHVFGEPYVAVKFDKNVHCIRWSNAMCGISFLWNHSFLTVVLFVLPLASHASSDWGTVLVEKTMFPGKTPLMNEHGIAEDGGPVWIVDTRIVSNSQVHLFCNADISIIVILNPVSVDQRHRYKYRNMLYIRQL